MRVSIAAYAPKGERFSLDAFDKALGSELIFLGHPARLVDADVHPSGDAAVLTIEVQIEPIRVNGFHIDGNNWGRHER